MSLEGIGCGIDEDKVESLRLILEREQHKPVNSEEALEIGESLLSFFAILADDSPTLEQE